MEKVRVKSVTTVQVPCDVGCGRLAKDGKHFAVGGEDKLTHIYEVGNYNRVSFLEGHSSAVTALAFDYRSERLATGSLGGSIKMWDLERPSTALPLASRHKSSITWLEYHPFGDFVASGSNDKVIRIWDARQRSSLQSYKGFSHPISVVKFSPDGRWAISGCKGGTVKLFDLTSGKLLTELLGHAGSITSVDFHPSDYLLSVTTSQKTVSLWEMSNFTLLTQYTVLPKVATCQVFGDRTHSLVCGMENGLRVYHVPTSDRPSEATAQAIDGSDVPWGDVKDLHLSEDVGELLSLDYKASAVSTRRTWLGNLVPFSRFCKPESGASPAARTNQSPNIERRNSGKLAVSPLHQPPPLSAGSQAPAPAPAQNVLERRLSEARRMEEANRKRQAEEDARAAQKEERERELQRQRDAVRQNRGKYQTPFVEVCANGGNDGNESGFVVEEARPARAQATPPRQQAERPPVVPLMPRGDPHAMLSGPALDDRPLVRHSPRGQAGNVQGHNQQQQHTRHDSPECPYVPQRSPQAQSSPSGYQDVVKPAQRRDRTPQKARDTPPRDRPSGAANGNGSGGAYQPPTFRDSSSGGGKNDGTVAQQVMESSRAMNALLQRRLTHMSMVRQLWVSDCRAALKHVEASAASNRDPGLVVDFLVALQSARLKEKLTAEAVPSVLKLVAYCLTEVRHELSLIAALKAGRAMNLKFRAQIDEGLRAAAFLGNGVDLRMEARVDTARALEGHFQEVRALAAQYSGRGDAVGKLAHTFCAELPQ